VYNNPVSDNMTAIEMLQTDLEIHKKSLQEIEDGTGAYFVRRAGYSTAPLIDSYRRIIASIEEEIATLSSRRRKKSL
jgi:hypothetical protein